MAHGSPGGPLPPEWTATGASAGAQRDPIEADRVDLHVAADGVLVGARRRVLLQLLVVLLQGDRGGFGMQSRG